MCYMYKMTKFLGNAYLAKINGREVLIVCEFKSESFFFFLLGEGEAESDPGHKRCPLSNVNS